MLLSDIIPLIRLFYLSALLALGMLLLFFKTAPELRKHKYRKAKRYLAISILIIVLGEGVYLFSGGMQQTTALLPLFRLLIALFQASLFTFLALILFHSPYVKNRNIFYHLLPTFLLSFAYIISIVIEPDVKVYTYSEYINHIDNPGLIIRTLITIVYVVQICIYTSLFKREKEAYKTLISKLNPNLVYPKYRFVTTLFYLSITIGFIVLVNSIYPTLITETLFCLAVPFLYIAVAIKFLNVQFTLLEVLLEMKQQEVSLALQSQRNQIETELSNSINREITEDTDKICFESERDQLSVSIRKAFLSDLRYRDPNINPDSLIEMLDTNRKLFFDAFHHSFGMSFSECLNVLRLKEAILLLEKSNLTIQEISEQVGYGSVRTFQRQFQLNHKMSPKEYRKFSKSESVKKNMEQ